MNCVSCDICVYHLGLCVFFPGVFLSSRVTRACPVTTDLIMRVNVRTTTTTTTRNLRHWAHFFILSHFSKVFDFPASFWTSRGHRCRPFVPPVVIPQVFIACMVQQSHCSTNFHRVLLTHALSESHLVHNKKSQRIYTSMYADGGL